MIERVVAVVTARTRRPNPTPPMTPMRHANPIVSPTHEPIWSCPSGPGHIVDWLRAHYEPEDASTIFVAVGGWRAVADAMCTGGWKSREDFENDWDVRWHMVENPEGGRPLYVVVSGGIENVFAPHGVDVDDLIRWADAWEERQDNPVARLVPETAGKP
jgi:hypothetical protein